MTIEIWDPHQAQWRKLLIYGEAGVGKTVFASTAPNPIFLDAEDGMQSVRRKVARAPIQKWQDVQNVFALLVQGQHPYQTAVLDSLPEFLKLAMDNVVSAYPKRRDYATQPTVGDWGKALADFDHMIRAFKSLPMHLILTCSPATKQYASDFIRPQLSGRKTTREVCRYMDIIGYMYTAAVDKSRQDYLLSFRMEDCVTKDRSGRLPPIITDPTWAKLEEYWQKEE